MALNSGDIFLVSLLFSFLGRRCLVTIYAYLPMLILVRGIWVYVHLEFVIAQMEPFASHFDFMFFMS